MKKLVNLYGCIPGTGLLALLPALFLACQAAPVIERPLTLNGSINTILLLPFSDLTDRYGETGVIKCPLSHRYFEAGQVSEGGETELHRYLFLLLSEKRNFRILTRNTNAEIPIRENASDGSISEHRGQLLEAGRNAQADAVLKGYIYRFIQRRGGPYAAGSPASVAFSLHLVGVAGGSDLWHGYVDETQTALSDNLFTLKAFINRKGRWITAEELARSGLENIMETFPQK